MGIASAGDQLNADGREVANFVLDECESAGRLITNLSLQKIVYFCHAWFLVKTSKPLIRHDFEAWTFGPVLQYLYRDFKEFDKEPITRRAKRLNPRTGIQEKVEYRFDGETEEMLRKVIGFYGRLRPGTLVELSHIQGGPWDQVWSAPGVNPGMRIDNAAIESFFRGVSRPF